MLISFFCAFKRHRSVISPNNSVYKWTETKESFLSLVNMTRQIKQRQFITACLDFILVLWTGIIHKNYTRQIISSTTFWTEKVRKFLLITYLMRRRPPWRKRRLICKIVLTKKMCTTIYWCCTVKRNFLMVRIQFFQHNNSNIFNGNVGGLYSLSHKGIAPDESINQTQTIHLLPLRSTHFSISKFAKRGR